VLGTAYPWLARRRPPPSSTSRLQSGQESSACRSSLPSLVRQSHQRIVPAHVRREYTQGRWGRKPFTLEYYGMDCYISRLFSLPFHAAGVLMYCLEVKKRLSSLDLPSKREALAALDVHVTWTPCEPVDIEGKIGVATASSISKYAQCLCVLTHACA